MSREKELVICKNVWKIFGPNPKSILDIVNSGMTNQQVFEQSKHVIAVKNVSFKVSKNEVFVIMGLSGSGKSTLLRCLNRLIEPTRGTIFIDDVDISAMNKAELREFRRHRISMVFQNFGLLPHRTVMDNVAFGLEVRGEHVKEREKKVIQALELVGLKGWEKNRIKELSGGMQQRVGLARAIVVGADIVLMDEPFSALDPLIRRQMQDEFINLSSFVEKTVIFITHDLLEALKIGDRVAIMKDGEIVQTAHPEEIVTQPADDYVREFVKDVPWGLVVNAKSIMDKPTVVIRVHHDIENCIKEMADKCVQVAFVVDNFNRFQGIMTTKGAEVSKRNGLEKVEDALISEYPSTSPDIPLEQVLPQFSDGNTSVAVLDEEQCLLGIIKREALFKAMNQDGDIKGGANHTEN